MTFEILVMYDSRTPPSEYHSTGPSQRAVVRIICIEAEAKIDVEVLEMLNCYCVTLGH